MYLQYHCLMTKSDVLSHRVKMTAILKDGFPLHSRMKFLLPVHDTSPFSLSPAPSFFSLAAASICNHTSTVCICYLCDVFLEPWPLGMRGKINVVEKCSLLPIDLDVPGASTELCAIMIKLRMYERMKAR